MYPYLVQSDSISIGSYGVMLAVAYLVGRYLYIKALKESCGRAVNTEALIISLLVFGLLGAKLMFMLKNPDRASFTDWSSITSGSGFSSQGAILAAILVTIAFSKINKVKLHYLLDSAAIPAIVAYALARIGCFLAGDDCYGVESHLPWAMAFPKGVAATTATVHPLPLYEVLYSLLIWQLLVKLKQSHLPPYSQFFALLTSWGFCRFLIEFISTNPEKLLGMSGSQIGALIMLVSGLVYFSRTGFSIDKKKPG